MIRDFKQEDLQACVRLLIETYNCEPWNDHWTIETASRYLNEFSLNKDFIGFIDEDNDEIVAAMFTHKRTWWTNDEIYVDELFVKPSEQRKGYGKSLLSHCENYCKENGLAGLTLATNRYLPAKTFYEKNSYTLAEHVIFFYKEV